MSQPTQQDRERAEKIAQRSMSEDWKTLVAQALADEREQAYSAGYSAGHEDQMRMRIRDEQERRARRTGGKG